MSTPRRIQRRALRADPRELPGELHPVLRRLYAARLQPGEGVDTRLASLLPTAGLHGLEAASALLAEAIQADQRILIVGDFDADGATSCALSMLALRAMGAGRVDYLVPNRFEYGYGLTPEIVELAAPREPHVIMTVDNGISSIEGVAAANARGIRVLVTDHHLPGAELPEAAAIVNPNLQGDQFPSKALAGVGVAFYVMAALRARLRALGWFDARGLSTPNLADYLDLVALGSVADVVPLDRNNRVLVAQGLERIRAGRCRPGISALLELAGRQRSRVSATDLGFAVGPRLNAAGRLEDMALGIECLLADSPDAAAPLAERLDELNRQRREIEAQMQGEALGHVEGLIAELAQGELPDALCLMDQSWHQGVIGLLASRIKERFHRPVLVFAPADERGETLKGSARSIPGLHVRDALERVATLNPGLVPRFGGHAMAAGLSLARADYPRFVAAFQAVVGESLDGDALERVLYTDGELMPDELNLELAGLLRDAGPWGQGFPEPLFDGRFDIVDARLVGGGKHLKLRLRHEQGGAVIDAIAFRAAEQGWAELDGRVRLGYRLDVNSFRGRDSVQLIVEHMEPVG
ncbi:single-stranded-DNA-specific exonuclease RecJ [Alkalilimnicola sp. S0819]|uniref:single-stranded-DNA-specific exonuclease RecJ n=1 Tax=Alkalilimnicola sp. S0819 TaxID=2613922 RepID=UPI00126174DE|nr:single-stranded-DNA-specific exonuclease RecJ [Alkalilimnicola sp. S0819]KAB7622653.1 single-stranded-DNA-specific exonuclease RecJ [Alkalilimnicola sp. S0819]MPQ17424.1 single-stranded-DNA-specific exonuclease RecJ [Alkalilimnicola sp. S0819]